MPLSSTYATRDQYLVAACMAAAAIGASVAGCHPTGLATADVAWSALLGASVAYTASRAHRRTWLFLAGCSVVTATGAGLAAAAVAVLAAVVGTTAKRRSPPLGAAIGAVSVQALLRLDTGLFHGSSALLAAIAVGPVLISGYGAAHPKVRFRARRAAYGFGALAAVAMALFGAALLLTRSDLQSGVDTSRAALRATREGNTVEADRQLTDAIDRLGEADRLWNSPALWPARSLPFVGQHATAVARLSKDGTTLARAARRTVRAVDYDRLRYRSGAFDLDAITDAQAPLADAATASKHADDDLRTVNSGWLVAPLQHRIQDFTAEVGDVRADATLASQIADVAPSLLGRDGERHYFIAFVTPAELRGSGGFIGSFGELTARDGRVRLTRSGPVGELIYAAPIGSRTLTGPADYLARYGPYNPADHFQDLTYSPNFPSDAQAIEQLYPQSGGRPVDGVLQVDPYGLAALLKITGPIQVAGIPEPLTSANAARILLQDQYELFAQDKIQDDALSAAARATFDKLTTGDLPRPRELGKALGPMVQQGRFKFHSTHPAEQAVMVQTGLAWNTPKPRGHDLVAVTTQNNGNSKIDVYLHRSISYRVAIDPATGRIKATARVTLENRAPASGLPSAVIGNTRGLSPGTSRMWLSLYSPLRLERAHIGAFTLPVMHDTEAGYSVYSQFVNVEPGATETITFDLTGATDHPDSYSIDLFPQPTVNPDRIELRIDAGRAPDDAPGFKVEGTTATMSAADGERHTLTIRYG